MGKVYSIFDFHNVYGEGCATEKQIIPITHKESTRPQEMEVTIHHTKNGPSLESCMISIISNHMSKNADF